MKVYGMIVRDGSKQRRAVVVAKTQKEAADKLGVTLHHFRGFASPTGNEHEIAVAMSKPGTVFWRGAHSYSEPYTERT